MRGKPLTGYALRVFPRTVKDIDREAEEPGNHLHLCTADHRKVGFQPRLKIRSAGWLRFESARTGFACLDSFYGWLVLAQRAARDGAVTWNPRDQERFCFRHWACSGQGTVMDPGLFYAEATWEEYDLGRLQPVFSKAHQCQHAASLAAIHR